MDEQTDDPDDAVTRLESALERIARLAGQPRPAVGEPPQAGGPGGPAEAGGPGGPAEAAGPGVPAEEIASRLDALIDRVRAALANRSG